MRPVKTDKPLVPMKDRLSTRLGLIFVGTFLVVTILLIANTMLGAIGDRSLADSDPSVAAPVIVIDPRIRTDFAKAVTFDIPPTTQVQNPFIDRAGIGTNIVAAPAPAVSQTAVASQTGSATAGTTRTGDGGRSGSVQSGDTSFGFDPSIPKARHDEWLDRQRRGEFVGQESEVLMVEDLVPVGYAGGGDRADEVMLFSLALCRTFSFPMGTRFLNGWLSGFTQREVVFALQNGILRKSYSAVAGCGNNAGPGSTTAGN